MLNSVNFSFLSYTGDVPVDTVVWLQGAQQEVVLALDIICDAVDRYKALCEGRYSGNTCCSLYPTLAALCTQHLLLFVPNSCCSLYPTVADLCTQQGFIALRTRQGFITLQQCGCWAGFCCYRQPSRLPILTCQAYAAVHAISAPVTEVYTCTRTFGVPFNDALQLCTSQDAMWSEHGKPYLGICIMLGGTA